MVCVGREKATDREYRRQREGKRERDRERERQRDRDRDRDIDRERRGRQRGGGGGQYSVPEVLYVFIKGRLINARRPVVISFKVPLKSISVKSFTNFKTSDTFCCPF